MLPQSGYFFAVRPRKANYVFGYMPSSTTLVLFAIGCPKLSLIGELNSAIIELDGATIKVDYRGA